MPYKSEKIIIAGSKFDRRIKLTDQQREEIMKSNLSQRKLAEMYGVSRRLIQFIKHPERYERNKKLRELRGGSKIYYDKDKNREAIKEHRRYKQNLYMANEIKLK